MLGRRPLLSFLLVVGTAIGCRGPSAEAEGPGEPEELNPNVYVRFSINARDLGVLWSRPGPDAEDVHAILRGRVHNQGEHPVSSVRLAYECKPDYLDVKGNVDVGPIPPGESLFVDEIVKTLHLPGYMSYRCKVEATSVQF